MMRILAYISNFISKILGKEKKDDEELKDDFDKIIRECEEDVRPIHQKQEDYEKKILKVIDEVKESEEIFKRSNIVEGRIDNREISDETKKIILSSVIEGYFRACKFSMKEGKKDSHIFIKSFECGVEIYKKYPDKAPFKALLERIDFKTGPLSEEDIRNEHLYYKELYQNEVEKLKMILRMTGVFGISGRRGTGKSTLLHLAINEIKKEKTIKQPLVVELTVPSEYKTEEEFLTVLLSKICEKTSSKGDSLDHLMNISYNLFRLFLVLSGILFLLYEILPAIFDKEIDYYQLISVIWPITLLVGFLMVSSLIVSIVFIAKQSHAKSLKYIYDFFHVHLHVNRIYSDIKFMKTTEITKGAEFQYFSFSRRITFQENPINYSTPLLSDKIKELIQEHILKIFDKVIIIIDDFDKLVDESARENILKSIRFLSSTKNCLTFIAVPEGFEDRLNEMNSEIRTLFDQFINLQGIKDEEKLQGLIKYRIMTDKIGEIFLEHLIENKEKDDKFYSTLLNKSRGIPREAIRSFNKCLQEWLILPILDGKFIFIDKSLLYKTLFSWDKIPGDDTERLREFLKHNFLIAWVKTAKIEKIEGGKAIRVSTKRNSLSLRLNEEKTKVKLEIDDGRAYEFTVKTENGVLYEDFEETPKMLAYDYKKSKKRYV